MSRRSISRKERAAIFARCGGQCHICGGKVGVGEAWDVEHIIPIALGGEDGGDNLAPAHSKCHRAKSAEDAGKLAKARSVEARHTGTYRPRSVIPGSKASGWKKRMDGTVERRPQ